MVDPIYSRGLVLPWSMTLLHHHRIVPYRTVRGGGGGGGWMGTLREREREVRTVSAGASFESAGRTFQSSHGSHWRVGWLVVAVPER